MFLFTKEKNIIMQTNQLFTPIRKWIISKCLKFSSYPIIFFIIATLHHIFFVKDIGSDSLAYMFNKLLVQIMSFISTISVIYVISFTIVLIYNKIKKRRYDNFLAFQDIICMRTRKLFWITLIAIFILSKLH